MLVAADEWRGAANQLPGMASVIDFGWGGDVQAGPRMILGVDLPHTSALGGQGGA